MFKLISFITAAPVITHDSAYKNGISQKAGSAVSILITISGHPKPSIKWIHNGEELLPSSNVVIEGDGTFSTLTIKKTAAANTGKYTVTAQNDVGSDQAEFDVIIKGLNHFNQYYIQLSNI